MAKASTMPLVRIGSDVSLSIRPHNVVTFRDGGQPSAKIGREEEERAGEEMAKRGGEAWNGASWRERRERDKESRAPERTRGRLSYIGRRSRVCITRE